jgi:outer membrane protein OmpA-like peptidoglycan-associated protein
MKNTNIKSYEDFVNEELSPKTTLAAALAAANLAFTSPALGQEKVQKPNERIVGKPDQIGLDLLGKKLTSAPSIKPIKLSKLKNLICTPQKNIQPEDEKALESRGWVKVWEEQLPDEEVDSIIPPKEPKSIELLLLNDKSFELGGFELTEDIRDRILCIIDQVDCEGYEIGSITIESSTDKTPIKPTLKDKLKSKGLEGTNEGLSKARAGEIKGFLVSKGVSDKDLNVNLLSEQGKEGGYDPSARYVKLKINLKSPGESKRTIKMFKKGGLVSYFQKITETKPQRVPTYKGECGHNCKVYE